MAWHSLISVVAKNPCEIFTYGKIENELGPKIAIKLSYSMPSIIIMNCPVVPRNEATQWKPDRTSRQFLIELRNSNTLLCIWVFLFWFGTQIILLCKLSHLSLSLIYVVFSFRLWLKKWTDLGWLLTCPTVQSKLPKTQLLSVMLLWYTPTHQPMLFATLQETFQILC